MCHPLSRKHASSESIACKAYRYTFYTLGVGSRAPFPTEGRFRVSRVRPSKLCPTLQEVFMKATATESCAKSSELLSEGGRVGGEEGEG